MTSFDAAAACLARIEQRQNAGRPWLTTDLREVTFDQLADRVRRVAALVQDRGLALGDRVVIATEDDCEAAQLFVSFVCSGVTVVLLDPGTSVERAQSLVAKAAPRMIIADTALAARWGLAEGACELLQIAAAPASRPGLLGGLMRTRPAEGLQAVLQAMQPRSPPSEIPPETLAYILFTSGTTLAPKGVCISHRALFSHLATLSRVYGYSPQSRILNTLMLSHTDGITQGPMIAFYNAAQLHRPLKFEITTLDRLLDCVFQLRITHMVAVPTMLSLMTRLGAGTEDAFQGGDFQLLISCGAALEPQLWEEVETRFGVKIINMYGLTETVTGGVFAGTPVGVGGYGSIGVPIDCELKIVGEDGAEVSGETAGELLMQGSLLMSGYFADEAQTAEVMRDGWFRTGDLARRDANGHYWICGRIKNIVIRGGVNIHPEEITEALHRHPEVQDAVAFGEPDPEWGERLLAIAVSRTATETDLLAHCSGLLEPRKVPSRVLVVEALPLGRSGKVMIAEARKLFDKPADVRPAASGDVEGRLLQVASHTFKLDQSHVRLTSTPDDILGWDSLAHLEFVTAVEMEFKVKFSPRQIMGLTHIGKALEVVRSA